MRELQIKFFILSLLFLLYFTADAQSTELNSISDSSVINNMINIYEKEIGQQSHLYNGKEYQNYAYRFREGNPFFIWDTWQKGNVSYDGTLYKDIFMLYDIVRDEVVIQHFNNISRINLSKSKVASFTLPGHTFIHISPDSIHSSFIKNGFYELLYAGKDSLLAKRTKDMQILYRATAAELKVFGRQIYYLKKDDKYYPVNNEHSFLRLFDYNKKEIRKYKKLNKLNYKKDPENTMVKIMSYNDQLTN
ncbi:MAG TPA: hypothetical protein VMY77_14715 [Chitinophagaceae bacterium]|nr:hypothetical protein [Chitinophagaceae bacterium]